MIFREASTVDIKQIQIVRNSVNENQLSNPSLVTDRDCVAYLTLRGKGWVCEIDDLIVGFAIADTIDHNIWALFVHPEYEGKGIGTTLHNIMLEWYFEQTKEKVWLSTSPGTKAEKFYRKHGWQETGIYGKGEIKFELSFENWRNENTSESPVGVEKSIKC